MGIIPTITASVLNSIIRLEVHAPSDAFDFALFAKFVDEIGDPFAIVSSFSYDGGGAYAFLGSADKV
jgi:hypothetical protein